MLFAAARLASQLDMNDPMVVRAAGGLLHWLLKNRKVRVLLHCNSDVCLTYLVQINEMESSDAPLVLQGTLFLSFFQRTPHQTVTCNSVQACACSH